MTTHRITFLRGSFPEPYEGLYTEAEASRLVTALNIKYPARTYLAEPVKQPEMNAEIIEFATE